jgi:hypothetical protein
MKTSTIWTIAATVACLWFAEAARAQVASGGLTVGAEASLLPDTNGARIFLTVHLINTTDHDITVLTRHLNVEVDGSARQTTFTLGYANPAITHDGHPVIPSLYDFSPVTLKPNEEAFVVQETHGLGGPEEVTADTQLTVRYTISPDWAKRLGLWSGAAESKPFTARVRHAR